MAYKKAFHIQKRKRYFDKSFFGAESGINKKSHFRKIRKSNTIFKAFNPGKTFKLSKTFNSIWKTIFSK